MTDDATDQVAQAWDRGFGPLLDTDRGAAAMQLLGLVAFSMTGPARTLAYLYGPAAAGKTTVAQASLDLRHAVDPEPLIASFEHSTTIGLLHAGAALVESVPPRSEARGDPNGVKLGELARAVANGSSAIGDKGALYTAPPFMIVTGERETPPGAASGRVLSLKLETISGSDVAGIRRTAARDARHSFSAAFNDWISTLDAAALEEEFDDADPSYGRPYATARFGVRLLDRFLRLHERALVTDDEDALEETTTGRALSPVVKTLADQVVHAVWRGTHRLVGGHGDDSAKHILGRIDDETVWLVPSVVMNLLNAGAVLEMSPAWTTAAMASELDRAGVLRRIEGSTSRTRPVKIEGSTTRTWETVGLFDDSQLQFLREGLDLLDDL